jgi:hypothetical protein
MVGAVAPEGAAEAADGAMNAAAMRAAIPAPALSLRMFMIAPLDYFYYS